MKLMRLAGLSILLAAGPAIAQEPVLLRLSADTPSTSGLWTELIVPWAKKIEAEAGGTIRIELYADGQLSKSGDTITRISAGVVDIGYDFPLQYGARFATLGVTGMPGLYTDPVKGAAAIYRTYAKGLIAANELKEFKVLIMQSAQPFAFYLRRAPKTNYDLSGLKVALGTKPRADLTQGAGGTPLTLKTTEYYQAIQKGVADGVMSSTGAIQAFKLDEVTSYYLYGPFGGGVTLILMSKAKYESLPAQARKAIDDNSGEAMSRKASKWLFDYENSYMAQMLKTPGNKQVFVNDEELAKWQPVFQKLVADWTTATPGGQAAYDAYKAELAAEK